MKRLFGLLFIPCCIGCCGTAFAQFPVIDTFSAAGAVNFGSSWTNINTGARVSGVIQQNAGVINFSGGVRYDPVAVDYYSAVTFGANQYAQFVVGPDQNYNSNSSPMVRVQAVTGNGYSWDWDLESIRVWTGGSYRNVVMTKACPKESSLGGHAAKLAALGSTIFCFDATAGTYGYGTDTTYTGGSPGIMLGSYAGHIMMSGPFQADCFPYSCNSVSASPYTALYPSTPVIDYYSPTAVTVTLAPTVAGWTVVYTTDGSTPMASGGSVTHGTAYTVPFTVSATGLTTVKTIATKSGSTNSGENDYTYNIGYQVPNENGCQLFPANSIFNAPIASLPVHTTYNTAFQGTYSGSHIFHDFQNGAVGGGSGGIPYNNVTSSTPTFMPVFTVSDESDAGPYNILPNTAIENSATPGCTNTNASPGPDYHLLNIANLGDSCQLQEIYQSSCTAGSPDAWVGYSGAIWPLASNALRPNTWTSADAAGLPITPFLAKYDEAVSGVINHPFRFTTHITGDSHVWPARHDAGSGGVVPIGVRLRLKASFDISTYSPMNQVILNAMKTYGMFLADNGNNGYFQGVSDPRWNETDLDLLNAIPFPDFEVVDESGLMLDANSQQIKAVILRVHWTENSMTQ